MNKFADKKVLVFGLGVNQGGVGAARFFAKQGAEVVVTDLKSQAELQLSIKELAAFPNIKYILGEHRFEDLDWADLIIKNPAVKPGNNYINYAKDKGKEIQTDISIFLQFISPKQIIGVTGTKGKSTTASLIYEVLKSGGKQVVFAGNIGKSVLDEIDTIDSRSLVVLELSSFQLEGFELQKTSPHWAVITNIYEDHLNYYDSMESYTAAKKIICKYQTSNDFLLLRQNDPVTTTADFLQGIGSQVTYFAKDDLPSNLVPQIPGDYNLENLAAAWKIGKIFNIAEDILIKTLKTFSGVNFRMELVKTWHGVKIYNDTTATNPSATIQALMSFPDCILIAGGQNANLNYDQLAATINTFAKEVYFLVGDATDQIKNHLENFNFPKSRIKGEFDNLEELLTRIKQNTQEGGVVLFSPGAKSFNQFRNEFDRGEQFNLAVNRVFKEP